jgi:trigger factor
LKVSTEKIPESQVLMTIEVEADRVEAARRKAVRKLSPRAKVPGFRPGKAPPELVTRYFGEERILDEALDDLVPIIYREAVEADQSIEPVARPRLVVETIDPLVVKATIPVRPTVDLGEYTSVHVEPEEVTVDETRVEETVTTLLRRHATLEPSERQIGWSDVVRIEVHGTVDGESMIEKQEAEIQLTEGRDVLFPGFEEALLGKKKGETFAFDLDVPETIQAEQFQGKTCHFTVTVLETKEEVLPVLDDAFAAQVNESFDTVEAMRQRIRDDIRAHEEDQRNNRYHEAILDQLVERATIEYPPVMVDAEAERLLHDQVGHQDHGEQMARYLAAVGKTEEQVRDELRPVAEARLRRSLVLTEVAAAENIEATDGEIDAEVETLSNAAGAQSAQLRELFGSPDGRATIRRNLVTRKTLARLVEIATEGGDAGKPKAPKKKKSSKAGEAATAKAPQPEPAAGDPSTD